MSLDLETDNKIINEDIDLKEVSKHLYGQKKFIFTVTAIFAITSVVLSLMLTNHYRSEAILVARDSSNNQSMFSEYAGLASLAGINISGSEENSVIEVIEIIKSREFIRHLTTFEGVMPSIMAAKSYDDSTGQIEYQKSKYNSETKEWNWKSRGKKVRAPSYLEAHEVFMKEMLSISQDPKNGLVSIKIEHISPIFAKDFLSLIIQEANRIKRNKDIQTSSEALDFLKNELANTPLVEIQESINQLIQAQLETQMVAKINEEYTLVMIEPPFIPEKHSRPSRSLISIIGTVAGFIFSIWMVLFRRYGLSH